MSVSEYGTGSVFCRKKVVFWKYCTGILVDKTCV